MEAEAEVEVEAEAESTVLYCTVLLLSGTVLHECVL